MIFLMFLINFFFSRMATHFVWILFYF